MAGKPRTKEYPQEVFNRAMALLRRGEVTPAELAGLAGISRQLVRHWAGMAGIDWRAAREARLTREWQRASERG